MHLYKDIMFNLLPSVVVGPAVVVGAAVVVKSDSSENDEK